MQSNTVRTPVYNQAHSPHPCPPQPLTELFGAANTGAAPFGASDFGSVSLDAAGGLVTIAFPTRPAAPHTPPPRDPTWHPSPPTRMPAPPQPTCPQLTIASGDSLALLSTSLSYEPQKGPWWPPLAMAGGVLLVSFVFACMVFL